MTGEGRLVRDCMQEKINRVTPYTRPVASDEEWVDLLQDKLLEEVAEVLRAVRHVATRPDDLLEELGDVYQVVIELAAAFAWSPDDVDDARVRKHYEKGALGTVLAWRQPDE